MHPKPLLTEFESLGTLADDEVVGLGGPGVLEGEDGPVPGSLARPHGLHLLAGFDERHRL